MSVSCSSGPAAVAAANAVSTSHGVGSLISGPTNFHELIEEGANLSDKFSYSAQTVSQSLSSSSQSIQQGSLGQNRLSQQQPTKVKNVNKASPVKSVKSNHPDSNLKATVKSASQTSPQMTSTTTQTTPLPKPVAKDVLPNKPSTSQSTQQKLPTTGQSLKGKKVTVKRLLDEGHTKIAIPQTPGQVANKKLPTLEVKPVSAPTPMPIIKEESKAKILQTVSLNEMSPILVTATPAVTTSAAVSLSTAIPSTSTGISNPSPMNQYKTVKLTLQDSCVLPGNQTQAPSLSTPTIIFQAKASSPETTSCLANLNQQTNSLTISGQKNGKGKRRGCRCGLATPNPGKLTCCGQRCPCYVDGKGCFDCKCRGCRNPHKANTNSGIPVTPAVKPQSSSKNLTLDSSSTVMTAVPGTASNNAINVLSQGSFIPSVTAVNLISLPVSLASGMTTTDMTQQTNNGEGTSLFISPNLTLASNAATMPSTTSSFCFMNQTTSPGVSDSLTLPLLDDMVAASSITSDECDLSTHRLSYPLAILPNDVS